jgi:hypothetical protein
MKGSDFWNVTFARLLGTYAIAMFVLLWLGFALALIVNPGWLDQIWSWARALPLVARVIVWLVFLPVMTALWIWQAAWPAILRLLGAAGIVGWTLLAISGCRRAWKPA